MRRLALSLALSLVHAGCAPGVVWVGRSLDRRTTVSVFEDGPRFRLAIESGPSRTYDTIAFDRLAWTRRGLLVPAQREGSWWIVDGAEERGPFEAVGEVVVQGAHAAFVAQRADGWHVVLDGAEGAAYDALAEPRLLDAERGSVAFVVTRPDGEHAVHDAAAGPACALVALLTLGAKGRMLAYVDRGAQDRLFVDHADAGTFERVLELVVAADEPRWAALVGAGDDTTLVHEGRSLATAHYLTHLRISDDGAHVACLVPADDGGSIDVIVDGAHVAHHRRVDGERLAFVPGDARAIFLFEDSQGIRVSLAGAEGERYEDVEGPVLAPHRAGWIGRRAEQSEVVIEGRVVATEPWAGSLALATHGEGYAYVARVEGERFVVTSRGRWPVPRLFVDTLVLDDEGRHWAALVPDLGARRLELWIDGRASLVLDDHELGGAISIETDRTLREVVRAVVSGALARWSAEHPD